MISTLKSCLLLSFGITVLQYPFTLAADCYGDKGQHPDEGTYISKYLYQHFANYLPTAHRILMGPSPVHVR